MLKNVPCSEENLLALIAEGDEVAFTKLFALYRDRIYSIAFKITHSTTASEEIVQDVFLKIWLRKDRLIEIQNFSAYLLMVTRNTVYKSLKRIAKNYEVTILTEKDHLVADSDSADLLMEKEYNLLLQKAIQRLPNQQKEVYQYIREKGLKREEAASLLHLSPETVKFHLAQAMKNIRTFCLIHLDMFVGFTIYILVP
ncbi:MAG: sigma-70 family RNA polymerase sigma factor [Ginsengibacter sp.]